MRLIRFDTLPSTHQYCELLDLTQEEEFTVVWAREQTAGIGQRGNHWESQAGENLSLSLILHPTTLHVADQYMLTKALSLALTDLLVPIVPQYRVRIKWPNDIYVDGGKICGILVSNQVAGNSIRSSICSIGLNVNQTHFSDWIPHPTSLSLLTEQRFDLETLLTTLVVSVEQHYQALLRHEWEELDSAYLAQLLHYREEARYLYEGQEISATIQSVNRFGHLLLTTASGEQFCCEMKKIQLLFD